MPSRNASKVDIETQASVSADLFQIEQLKISTPLNGDNEIRFSVVYYDGDDAGSEVELHRDNVVITDQVDVTAIFDVITSGGTMYDELKAVLYAEAVSQGKIPGSAIVE